MSDTIRKPGDTVTDKISTWYARFFAEHPDITGEEVLRLLGPAPADVAILCSNSPATR